MQMYPKIQTVFKRDPASKHKTLLVGDYSLPEFAYLANNEWTFTEKVDGTNIRVGRSGDTFEYRGKTDNAQMPPALLAALQQTFEPLADPWADIFDGPVTLYGEGYGAKIQKGGGNYRRDQGFVLFDVRVGDWWLQRQDVEDVASKLGIDVVPVIDRGSLSEMVDRATHGIVSQWGDFQAEGIVARPSTELCTRSGDRIITKIKCRDFRSS